MTVISPPDIAAAFEAACRDELAALKPGNVHRHADGHRMTVADFEASAVAAAPSIARAGLPVGQRILLAGEMTRAAVGTNTNLGILLLAGPLAVAAQQPEPAGLRRRLAAVLAALNIADAGAAFRAIRLANPAGLGTTEDHDVAGPATVTLRAAMAAAADRDRIARQYVTDYADVFDLGLPALEAALARDGDREAATTAVHLAFLAAFPDSHVARKHGPAAAEAVREEAVAIVAAGAAEDPRAHHDALMAFDTSLKARGLNPGTSADLTVATLFAERLQRRADPAG